MFDLDVIEKDWKQNSFYLTDEEVRKIYISEGITTVDYNKEIKDFEENLPKYKLPAVERVLASIFGDEDKLKEIREVDEKRNKIIESQYPKRKYLSHESQMKVVEGCMDVVFTCTRHWYSDLEGNIPMEKIYDICLDSLLKSAKYCIHYSTKNCFRAYVSSSITKNIIKYIASKEHISYRNVYCIMYDLMNWYEENKDKYDVKELKYDYDKEIPYKPSSIYEMTKNNIYEVDYIKQISSDEFMADYKEALDELTDKEKTIMNLLFDSNGFAVLTFSEISEILGVEQKEISNVKRRVIQRLRKDNRFDKYRLD